VPSGGALGKVTVNVICPVMALFFDECCLALGKAFAEYSTKKHSTKMSLPTNFLPCTLCRVRHSAKRLIPVVETIKATLVRVHTDLTRSLYLRNGITPYHGAQLNFALHTPHVIFG
jgi:hypothetical protein